MTQDPQPSSGSPPLAAVSPTLPYDTFLAERAKIVEARQRVQQRSEQLVTGGAVGALVLSITFLDRIAPDPNGVSRLILGAAWVVLLLSLSFSLTATLVSQKAFDDHLAEFDSAFCERRPFRAPTAWVRWAQRLSIGGASLLFAGVAALAAFAFLNISSSP